MKTKAEVDARINELVTKAIDEVFPEPGNISGYGTAPHRISRPELLRACTATGRAVFALLMEARDHQRQSRIEEVRADQEMEDNETEEDPPSEPSDPM